jgi:hypothetical protein
MRKTSSTEDKKDELAPEYHFDYSKAKPNRFAASRSRVVVLDEDVARVFTTPEAVNKALRALLEVVPPVPAKE